METMVERVAASMWDACAGHPEMPMFAHEVDWADDWPAAHGAFRRLVRDLARAAIEAMREPTDEMLQAGWDETDEYADVGPAYRAMVNAALTATKSEQPPA